MPITKEKNGTYTVRFYSDDPLSGSRKQIKKRGFKTRREAVAWEVDEKSKPVSGKTSLTFWDVFQKMLANNDTTTGTRAKKEAWISKYFEYSDLPIEKITKPMLIEWRNGLKSAGIATRTMNCGLQYVRSVFTFYSTVYGRQNVGIVLKSFKLSKADKTEMKIWTPAEFKKVSECIDNPVYRAYFEFLFWTGCRRGEAVALCKEDVNGNMVHIHRSMKHFKNGFQPLKTDSSERTIRVDSQLLEVMQPMLAAADPFVFGGVHPMPVSKIDVVFKRAIKKAGVDPIRIHDLRHSHASFLLNSGANILAVSKRLGHATITQTLETYAHLLSETDDKMMEIIEKSKK